MSKSVKYAKNGALLGGIANAIINAIKQLNQMENNSGQKFDWKKFFIAGGKGAIAGGASGFVLGSIKDYNNSLERPVNTDAFLYGLINKVRLDKTDKTYINLNRKADQLIELLKCHFNDKLLYVPTKLGSTEKGTALMSKFDIDICLSFKPKSFTSTDQMFHEVLAFLDEKTGSNSINRVRDQKKSIGVFYVLNGKEYKIDVVPYKISPKPGNKTSGYLYVNDSNFFVDNSSYTKTNIHALKNIRLSDTQKKLVIVLKYWKIKNDLPLSSHLLENLVIDAYEYNRNNIPKGFTKKIIMVLQHIANKLDIAVIRSVENTNNILTNISEDSKTKIIDACIQAIEDYRYQPNSIVDNFGKDE